ncbi:MAG: aminotransferase class I/II-fold pyridoxal phosphate-dependent enzyme [Clostridiales bacterium]|jgi:dTDP-4-amino-4,6-dideoxygalactose transaminase|nr:aminotransferase class I/II-fold pyridoxal phosphate-dependent enzyme [Clostridiales bacterium]
MKTRIPLSTPTMNGTEMSFIQEAFDTNWIAPLGPHVDAFEREIADYIGGTHAAALSSGTAAIHLALKAAGVGPGDVVLCQDLTFAASCNPIMYEKAVPVFIDSERQSWNMYPKALEAAFAKYPHTKAVIAVNLYGTPAKLDAIAEICRAHGAVLIEDAAESLGSTLHAKQTGGFGDIGILSFNGNKIITTSGGGMLLCNDESIVKKAKFWATQARDAARHYQHSELGYNYRMSNICAGIGRGQLTTLDLRIAQKTNIYNTYAAAFNKHDQISMNPVPTNCKSNYWLSCIILEDGSPVTPTDILERLEQENIEGRPIWKPMSLQPYYRHCDFITSEPTSVGHDIFARGLCLPSDVKMTGKQQNLVCDIILDMF